MTTTDGRDSVKARRVTLWLVIYKSRNRRCVIIQHEILQSVLLFQVK